MSPEYHQIIVELVTNEMNLVVERVNLYGGGCSRVSFLSHSLGSVISWDILANQEPRNIDDINSDEEENETSMNPNNIAFAANANANTTLSIYPKLNFHVENCFMIGSPVAVFLMVRNNHTCIDENYSLPGCDRVFNVFHPFDPAAYRLEPLINRRNVNFEPVVLPTWTGGFRVQ